ncbi:EAL domain-containing protein [Alginatibacterium sediminis]|uniref:EAL domain-containing protein n=1 Tax=Alginatibacterium sediminis TaxID=2164068 RepID=A0A420E706_9ALTE|nr:EAL domain-containing protein [Alginatibacterium sediminis]
MAFMVIFVLVFVYFQVSSNRSSLEKDITSLRDNFYSFQQSEIQNRVLNVVQQITTEIEQTENSLRRDIENRVNDAIQIATNIYAKHHETHPGLTKEFIIDALRPIRFNQGRGYYFVYDLDGTNVVHPIQPQLEGKNLIAWEDRQGNHVIKELSSIALNDSSGFHRWWWTKPKALDETFEKIGFVTHFEPYNWFIGTGEYVVDVARDIQQKVLKTVANYRYENNDYIFIINSKGALLAHPNPAMIGVERLDATDKTGSLYIKALVDKAKQGGGFVRYHSSFSPLGSEDTLKLSYVVYLPQWDWVVGTGVYLGQIETFLSNREAEIKDRNSQKLGRIIVSSALMAVILGIISLYIGEMVSKRFLRFQSKINTDMTRLEDAKDRLHYQAHFDSLTGLANRIQLNQFITKAIKNSQDQHRLLAVMFVDLDDFKKVNDAYGHPIGDALLVELGKRFGPLLNENQMVSRFGGDEFVFCFPELENLQAAKQFAQDILAVFDDEFIIMGKTISTACSVGVAICPTDADNADELITKADTALYSLKANRKGRYLFFDDSIQQKLQYEMSLERELRGALENQELSMHYQPQVCLETKKIMAVESLLRWKNPKLGQVSPIELIRKAEETGLIHQIGRFVIKRSCEQVAQAFASSQQQLGLSINISPLQLLEPLFTEDLIEIVDEYGLSRGQITIEITEHVLINDFDLVTPVLNQLQHSGFSIALDDFGTGYSSLNYLYTLPINEIKIDQSFVRNIMFNKQSDSLVKAIIAIGESHDLKVVAEGIETQEQCDQLGDYKCHIGQGYLFAKPLVLDDLKNFIQNNSNT